MQSAEEKLKTLLVKTGKTLSTAESCTGGLISHRITTVSGSSSYYLGSVISYANSVKMGVLGVSAEVLESEGPVCSKVARMMAEGVRKTTGATYSVSTTGLAEGSDEYGNPEGTVWIGVSGPKGTDTLKFISNSGERKKNIGRFADAALDALVSFIEKDLSTCISE
ncbi:MAG: CinA family protein [Bacteroidales bacterium]|nr:CinA family protein [Bacteroidales bacterium]